MKEPSRPSVRAVRSGPVTGRAARSNGSGEQSDERDQRDPVGWARRRAGRVRWASGGCRAWCGGGVVRTAPAVRECRRGRGRDTVPLRVEQLAADLCEARREVGHRDLGGTGTVEGHRVHAEDRSDLQAVDAADQIAVLPHLDAVSMTLIVQADQACDQFVGEPQGNAADAAFADDRLEPPVQAGRPRQPVAQPPGEAPAEVRGRDGQHRPGIGRPPGDGVGIGGFLAHEPDAAFLDLIGEDHLVQGAGVLVGCRERIDPGAVRRREAGGTEVSAEGHRPVRHGPQHVQRLPARASAHHRAAPRSTAVPVRQVPFS